MVGTHGNIFQLIVQAGPVVKVVLSLLISMSIVSWTIVLGKYFILKNAEKQGDEFLEFFWQEKKFEKIHELASTYDATPLARMFESGYREMLSFKTKPVIEESIVGCLRKEADMEMARLEKSVSFLATIGNTAPFIGLFGTVWGIMDAFRNIGVQGSASLATVAPGIAEALIATACGLFVAIPAVIFYNHYVNKVDFFLKQMDHFEIDFLNATRR